MNRVMTLPARALLVLVGAWWLAGCSGGGGGGALSAVPTLTAIALSPQSVQLQPGGTGQLTVTGTYSNGSSQALTSGVTFTSSNTAVVTVSQSGALSAPGSATAGQSATITATDTASGIATGSAGATTVTIVAAGAGAPTPTSASAATDTASQNALCTAITPFYWEIGNGSGTLVSASVTGPGQTAVTATKPLSIASASKMVYGAYVVQKAGGIGGVSSAQIPYLNFTSGYTNLPDYVSSSSCPGETTINGCLTLTNSANGLPYTQQIAANVGAFYYDSGHLEVHASKYTTLGNLDDSIPQPNMSDLAAAILDTVVPQDSGNTSITFMYTEPLMAGGIFTEPMIYAQFLQNIVNGTLAMHDALGTNAVCTDPKANGCNAAFSPIPEAWHYSIAHWVEDDPSTYGDGAFSSAGAFGFYPWVEAGKAYYGMVAREQGSGNGEQNGYASAQCGRLIRHAWDTGVQQTGTLPNQN